MRKILAGLLAVFTVACGVERAEKADLLPAPRPLFSIYWSAELTSTVCVETVTVITDGGIEIPTCAKTSEVTQQAACATVDVPFPAGCLAKLDAAYQGAGCSVSADGLRVDCPRSAPLTDGCVWSPMDAPTAASPNPWAICN